MIKLIIAFIISLSFISCTQAEDKQSVKKEYTKAEEEAMIKKFLQYQKEIDKSNKEVAEAKAETESAKKVNEKLDEILGILDKDKK